MPDRPEDNPADILFAEGMKYDWKQDQMPAAAALARAVFQQSAAMGNSRAVRALAHLIYDGRGGPQAKEQALLLLWSAFKRGDHEALEELADMLGTYAEAVPPTSRAMAAAKAAHTLEELSRLLSQLSGFMSELVRERSLRSEGV